MRVFPPVHNRMMHGVPYQVENLVRLISQCTRTFFKTDEKPEPDFSWDFQSADLLFFRNLCVPLRFSLEPFTILSGRFF
jgi:hypothetical protein